MVTFVKPQLQILRVLQLCAQLDSFVRQALPLSAGPAIFANQGQAHQHQLMVPKVTFVRQVTGVLLEQR